jgi:peptide/nickel transport system substrate-binding protein
MGLDDDELREWVRRVASGEASRRDFIRTMLGLGLSGPLIAEMLATCAPAAAQGTGAAQPTFTPTRRGGGGKLRLLAWNAPTILNPHLAGGGSSTEASRVVYEPLAAYNPDGDLIPILAEELPSVENGGLSPDGTGVTWRLKQGVAWHDGKPCTADDVIFTWEYAADPATTALTRGSYENIRRIDKLNDHAIKVMFKEPTPFWYDAFCGRGVILPRHLFAEYTGQQARHAPYNVKPVGTGPYKLVDFKPGDVGLYAINPHYHVPNRPFFDTIEYKGGGDATSAARAVVQTGEFDYALNMQVDKDVRERLEQQGRRGKFSIYPGAEVEIIWINHTDPWTEVDGERSSLKVPHPFLTDLRVRQALAAAVDRGTIAEQLYGAADQPTNNFLVSPKRFHSPNTRWAFDLDKASQLLEQAGWKRGSDGVRVKDGRRMQVVYQTSTNLVRQKTQAIVKRAFERIGIEVELKAVPGSVYFAGDPGNSDNLLHFYADLQMDTPPARSVDPQARIGRFGSWQIPQKANNWTGGNVPRWVNAEYDRLWQQAATELDAVRRGDLCIRMNDLIINDVVVIPIVWRHGVVAVSHQLRGMQPGPWDSNFWNLAYWYREA